VYGKSRIGADLRAAASPESCVEQPLTGQWIPGRTLEWRQAGKGPAGGNGSPSIVPNREKPARVVYSGDALP
jgi:hypothetical protein